MSKTTPTPAATVSMKHLRTLFVDKYLESTVKHLCSTDVPVSQGRSGIRERGLGVGLLKEEGMKETCVREAQGSMHDAVELARRR
jgi:hypothetical protein